MGGRIFELLLTSHLDREESCGGLEELGKGRITAAIFEREMNANDVFHSTILPTLACGTNDRAGRAFHGLLQLEVKMPATSQVARQEESHFSGSNITPPLFYWAAGLAVAEAIEHGWNRRKAAGLPIDKCHR